MLRREKSMPIACSTLIAATFLAQKPTKVYAKTLFSKSKAAANRHLYAAHRNLFGSYL